MGIVRFIFSVHMIFCALEIFYLFFPDVKNIYLLKRIHIYMQRWILPLRKKMRQMSPQWASYQDYAPIVLLVLLFFGMSMEIVVKIYMWVLIIEGISHFFVQWHNHPLFQQMRRFTQPVISRIQSHVALVNGMDLSYIIAIILCQFLYWIW